MARLQPASASDMSRAAATHDPDVMWERLIGSCLGRVDRLIALVAVRLEDSAENVGIDRSTQKLVLGDRVQSNVGTRTEQERRCARELVVRAQRAELAPIQPELVEDAVRAKLTAVVAELVADAVSCKLVAAGVAEELPVVCDQLSPPEQPVIGTLVEPTVPPLLGALPAELAPVEGGPTHNVDGAHTAPLDELKQHPLSQSPPVAHGVAQVSEMHGPEQHQLREQLPPGPAHAAADVSISAGMPPAKQVLVDVQTPAPSKQQRLSQSNLESHGPAQTSELQIALPQQGMSQLPPGGEHLDIDVDMDCFDTLPLAPLLFAWPASELAFIALAPLAPLREVPDGPADIGELAGLVSFAGVACFLVAPAACLLEPERWKHDPFTHESAPSHRCAELHLHPSEPGVHEGDGDGDPHPHSIVTTRRS